MIPNTKSFHHEANQATALTPWPLTLDFGGPVRVAVWIATTETDIKTWETQILL